MVEDWQVILVGVETTWRNSSIKNWGWVVAHRRSLNCSIIPSLQITAKLAAERCQIDLHRRFTHALLGPAQWSRKLYCARKQADSYPVSTHEICTAGDEWCEWGYGWVCGNLWCRCHRNRSWRIGLNRSVICTWINFTTVFFWGLLRISVRPYP